MMSFKNITKKFSENGGFLLESFTHFSNTQVDLLNFWKDKIFLEKERKSFF